MEAVFDMLKALSFIANSILVCACLMPIHNFLLTLSLINMTGSRVLGPIRSKLIPVFIVIKKFRVFELMPGWDASSSQGSHNITEHFLVLIRQDRERHCVLNTLQPVPELQ